MRAFIAIDFPNDIHEKLAEVSSILQSELNGLPIRWVQPNNIHLTLKFLGEVSEANIEMIAEILKAMTRHEHPFEISIGGLGVFPNAKQPRIIWLGIEAPKSLFSLQRQIDTETEKLGYPADRPNYSPHLTCGRVTRNADSPEIKQISSTLKDINIGFVGGVLVRHIHLYQSNLRSDGPRYSILSSAELSAA